MKVEATKVEADKYYNSTQKSFIGPKHGHFQELEQEVMEFVCLRKRRVRITCVAMKCKAQKLAKSHNFHGGTNSSS